jgi:hypothetical protein
MRFRNWEVKVTNWKEITTLDGADRGGILDFRFEIAYLRFKIGEVRFGIEHGAWGFVN